MKVVWINKEWNALIFVVNCTAHSFFRQCDWSRWCPKIPVEHSKLVTETSSYLLHRSHFWKIIPVELDQFNMGKFRTQYSNLDLKYTCPSLWHCWTSGNARVMHVHTFCFSYGKLNWVSPPPLWHFFLQGFLCISTAKQWNGFSFVQTNIASRVEMFLGREIFLHKSVWEHNWWISVFRETSATEALRQASRHVGWISLLHTKQNCFIADLNNRCFSCIHFFHESISSVCVGWTKNVMGSAKCNYFLEATFFLNFSDILYNFLISDLHFKIDVYALACFFWHVTRLLNPNDSDQLSTYHQTARTWKSSGVLFAAANHHYFKTTN